MHCICAMTILVTLFRETFRVYCDILKKTWSHCVTVMWSFLNFKVGSICRWQCSLNGSVYRLFIWSVTYHHLSHPVATVSHVWLVGWVVCAYMINELTGSGNLQVLDDILTVYVIFVFQPRTQLLHSHSCLLWCLVTLDMDWLCLCSLLGWFFVRSLLQLRNLTAR